MADTAPAGSIKAGGAYVELFTVDGPFHKGMASAQKKMQSFSSMANEAGKRLATVGGAISAAFGGSLVASAKLFAEAGDSLDKMSQRTGIAVESLSALDYAARKSGTSIEQIDDAIKDMGTKIVEAVDGSQGMIETFDKLGLSANELQSMNPEKQFMTIADALSQIPDTGRRAALAMQVFGEGGRQLLPMLAGGSAGIQEMMDKAKELGLVMSKEDAEAAKKLNEAFNQLESSTSALTNQVGAAFAPELTNLANVIRDAIPQIVEWIKANKDNLVLMGQLAALATTLGAGLMGVSSATNTLASATGSLAKAWPMLIANWQLFAALGLVAIIAGITYEIYQQVTAQRELNKELERQKELHFDLMSVREKNVQNNIDEGNAKKSPKERKEFFGDLIGSRETDKATYEKRIKDLNDKALTLEAEADAMDSEGDREQAIMKRGEAFGVRSGPEMKEAQDQLAHVNKEIEAYRAQLNRIQDKTVEASTVIPGFVKSIADAYQMGVDEVDRQMKDLADDMIETIATPAEKLQKKMAQIDMLKAAGKLTDDQYNKLEKQARLDAGVDSAKSKLGNLDQRTTNAAAVQKGSQEAFSAIAAAMQGRDKIETQIEKNTKATANGIKQMAKFKQGVTVKEFNITA